MFEGWNRFETGGALLRRKSAEINAEEESAEIHASDMQKITEIINIEANAVYSANVSGRERETDFRILKTGINLNVSQVVLKNLTLGINFSREVYSYTKEFADLDRSINIGSMNIKYSF